MVLGGGALVGVRRVPRPRARARRRRARPVRGARGAHRPVGDLVGRAGHRPTSRPGARSPTSRVFAAGVAAARLAPRAPDDRARRGAPGGGGRGGLRAGLARLAGHASRRTSSPNRIGAPFQYWNAVGTTAALAVPGAALARLAPHAAARSAARSPIPALGVVHPRDPAHPVARRAGRGRASPRSPGSRSCRCGCAACRCCWRRPPRPAAVAAWALSKDAFSKTLAAARGARRAWPGTSACCSC